MEYLVKSNLKFDSKAYKAGDKIELSEQHAMPLLRGGVISALVVEEKKAAPMPVQEPKEEAHEPVKAHVSKPKGKAKF